MMMGNNNQQSASTRTLIDALAGAAAGVFARTVVAPIDRVKLLIQLSGSIPSASAASSSPKTNPLQIFRGIIQKEGILSLWRGNTPTILIEGGSTALNFVFLNWYKLASHAILTSLEQQYPSLQSQNRGDRKRRLLQSFVSGGLAGATTISFLYPLGFMRTRLATDVGNKGERMYPNGMRDVLCKIWSSDGFRGFYKGYGIALVSVSMHRFVYLGGCVSSSVILFESCDCLYLLELLLLGVSFFLFLLDNRSIIGMISSKANLINHKVAEE